MKLSYIYNKFYKLTRYVFCKREKNELRILVKYKYSLNCGSQRGDPWPFFEGPPKIVAARPLESRVNIKISIFGAILINSLLKLQKWLITIIPIILNG